MELNRGMIVYLESREKQDLKELVPDFKKRFHLSQKEANEAIAKYSVLTDLQRGGE